MRTLIISDVHSNLEALRVVLHDASRRGGFDVVWSLGDLVGYGPEPGECIDLLRQHNLVCIAGNHDQAVAGKLSLSEFNTYAADAARWTATQLEPHQVDFLSNLRKMERIGDFTLVHGTLQDPLWGYLVDHTSAVETFNQLQSLYCLVGHSHLAFLCAEMNSKVAFQVLDDGGAVRLGSQRLIINPGSVGQPRDGDPRPSYAVYDSDAAGITHYRVAYNVSITQEKMLSAGLPSYLIHRLSQGR